MTDPTKPAASIEAAFNDTLQTAPIPSRAVADTATAENSTTLKIALASQKRWRIAAAVSSAVSVIGFALASTPSLLIPGLIIGGVGFLGGIVFGAISGAEVDEKAITAIAERVGAALAKKPGGSATP